jgi:indole-3-glycerol phosphate synthase
MEIGRQARARRVVTGGVRELRMGLLDDILSAKHAEAHALGGSPIAPRPDGWTVRDALGALRRPPGTALRLVAELKFRSPSAGPLSRVLGPAERSRAYERAGASMISVLTDRRWFDGSFEFLSEARRNVSVPLLCKDFVVDPAQIERAWAAGADAVLIIVRCAPDKDALCRLVGAACTVGIEPLLEVTDEHELEAAVATGARMVGVNARDLDTLAIDTNRAARVLAAVPPSIVAIHLSGVRDAASVGRVAATRADAALIGEALMRNDDPEPLLDAMVQAARRQADEK